MPKKLFFTFWPQIFIFLVVSVFFLRLFFPPSIFTTPDFGRSDLLHLNSPNKYELSKNLHNLSLGLWQNNIAQGYPTFSEAITGTFFLPNFIIFLILPFEIASPTLYLATFLIAAYGMYYLLRVLKLDKYSSVFGSLSFTFSAAMVLRISHTGVIQTVSLFPLVLALLLKFTNKPSLKAGLISTLALSQLFFVGFTQIFVYATIIFSAVLLLYRRLKINNSFFKYTFSLGLIFIFSAILCAVQIIPAFELTRFSVRQNGVDPSEILSGFPLSIHNFLTYINPYIIGSADRGTYNSLDWQHTGIYWENTAYIGIAALLLFIGAIAFTLIKGKKEPFFLSIVLICFLTILLSIGKLSPLHIVFSLPPLNFFRVPARFNLFTQFFAVILASFMLSNLITLAPKVHRLKLFLIIIAFTIINLFYVWWPYHPIGETKKWLAPPQTLSSLDKNYNNYRILSIDPNNSWGKIFVNHGWQGHQSDYKFFLNSLEGNYNSFFDVNQLKGYVVLPTRRYSLQLSLLNSFKVQNNVVEISSSLKKTLDNLNVRYIVSTSPIKSDGLSPINSGYRQIFVTQKNDFKYLVYESSTYKPKFSMYYHYQTVNTFNDYEQKFTDSNLDLSKVALLEKPIKIDSEGGASQLIVNKNSNGEFDLTVTTNKAGILVVSDSYYPGWEAKVDGTRTDIIPANINSKAIIVPQGTHHINLSYKPLSFKIGVIISILSHLFILLLLIKILKSEHHNIRPTNKSRA